MFEVEKKFRLSLSCAKFEKYFSRFLFFQKT
jgi:hypothetical protein